MSQLPDGVQGFPRVVHAPASGHQADLREQDPMTGMHGVAGAGPGPAQGPGKQPADGAAITLRILATTDVHSQILSYDYYTNRPQFGLGLAQTAALIADARAEVAGSLLLDNGDFLQGSALADLAASPRRRRPHPAITAFSTLHYDAVCLGNHEFNYGLDGLAAALRDAPFPALSANVARHLGADPTEDTLLVTPYALIRRELHDGAGRARQITVGVLGLTPPEILAWDRLHLQGRLSVRPMAQAARAWVPRMRQAGADVVVCLAHTGIALTGPGHAHCHAVELAGIDGIDVIVAGHTHQVFPSAAMSPAAAANPGIDATAGLVCGKPTVQPGHSGSHLGVVDLVLRPGPGGWRVDGGKSQVIGASEVVAGLSPARLRAVSAPLRKALAPDHRAALGWTRQRIGESTIPLSSHFALVADVQMLRLVAAAKCAHVRAALKDRPEASLPVLASGRVFRAGGLGGPLNYTDIPAGPLSIRHVFDLYPFPNTLSVILQTGRDLRLRLERSAALLRRLAPGVADQTLFDPDVPGFDFETISDLSYRIDPTARPGSRISGLAHKGRPVADADRFVFVSNSHDAATLTGDHPPLLEDRTLCTTVIADHIRRLGRIAAIEGPGWSMAPLPPGTSILHDCGPGALAHLDTVARLRPELVGITAAGYHRFRLHL